MFSKVNNLCWHIRYTRNKSDNAKVYPRYASVEKKRLIKESGVDKEELRLYCRALSGRLNHHAERRLEAYRKNQQ
ncbi:MAG: hypothetical protein IPN87_18915 [Saprospiraceae bacterium]|nr:hypothetical protein [Candidatus Brachybacter algidus]